MRLRTQLKDAEILTDPLKVAFDRIKERAVTEEEAKQIDVTELIWHSLETRIGSGELVNVQVRGDPTTGKSTVASKIVYKINQLLGAGRTTMREMNRLIFSDQIEFIRWTKKRLGNICIQIDEWNRMVQTGYNATTEMTLFDYYSDVFAQRFVHRVSCSPSQVVDRNCYLFLDIEGRDLQKKVTRLKVTYRDIITGEALVVGHFDIFVGDIILMDWYKRYREKKFRRMTLLENNGIRDVRELEFAYIGLEAFGLLCRMAKTRKVPANTVNKTVDIIRRKEGRIYSMLTMNEITSRCKSLLDLLTDKIKYIKMLKKAKTDVEAKEIREAIQSVMDIFVISLTDETRLSHIYDSYINMGAE